MITLFGSAAAKLDNNEYLVAVLNLYNLDGSVVQDMLVATTVVPEPATMLLLGLV